MEKNVRNLVALDLCNDSLIRSENAEINFKQFGEMVEEFGGEDSYAMKMLGWFSLADKIISTVMSSLQGDAVEQTKGM